MTDDILMRMACFNDGNALPSTVELINDMQDRIEQLEAALDQLLDDMGEDGLCVCQQAKDEARAALGEKKDG